MKEIALWGAGIAGRYLLDNISSEYRVKYVIDKKATNICNWKYEVPLVLPEQGADIGGVYGIIIAQYKERYIPEIIQQMKAMNVQKVGIVRCAFNFQKKFDWNNIVWVDLREKGVLPYLEVGIYDQCNLKCKGCTHFSNLYAPEDRDEEGLEELERELAIITKHMYVKTFRILGGEPFLSPHITEYLHIARKYLPNSDIRVVTNGVLILKSSDDIFDGLRKNRIGLDISAYPPVQKHKEAIVNCLEKEKIDYNFTVDITQFYRTLCVSGTNNPEISYNACRMNTCRLLRHGRIHTCPLEGMLYKYIDYYKADNFKLDRNSLGIDIFDGSLDWNNLYRLLDRPIELCRFCDEKGGEFFDWAVSANPKKEEWLISTGK